MQRFDISGLGRLIQLGAEFARRDKNGGEAALAGLLQDAGVGHIADDQDDLGGDLAGGAGVGNGGGIGAFAGAKEGEPKYFPTRHVFYIPQIGAMRKPEPNDKTDERGGKWLQIGRNRVRRLCAFRKS